MAQNDSFISVVAPCRNSESYIVSALEEILDVLKANYTYYELIIVDDASTDGTFEQISALLSNHESLRLFRMAHRHGIHLCISAGLDSAIGDYVVVMNPLEDSALAIPEMVKESASINGVCYVVDRNKYSWRPIYWACSWLFSWYCKRYLAIDIQRGSTIFRVFSRAAINNLIQTKDRSRILRVLTANAGVQTKPFFFAGHTEPKSPPRLNNGGLFDQVDVAFELLVSSSQHPLRWLSRIGLAASFLNLLYICYIVGIYFLKSQVAEGWTTLSMQNAIMFFLLFSLLTILCEYIGKLHMESQERPLYSVLEERNSSVLIDSEKRRNVVD